MKTIRLRAALASAALLTAGMITAQKNVTLTIGNIPNDSGSVLIATDKGQTAIVKAVKGTARADLKDVPEGTCWIYAFHDANGNKQLDKENNVPEEYCGMGQYDIKDNGQTLRMTLEYIPDKIKKSK